MREIPHGRFAPALASFVCCAHCIARGVTMTLKTFFSFRGRANRKQYWLTVLCVFSALLLLALAVPLMNFAGPILGLFLLFPWMIASAVFALWSNLAVSARRLHDRGKSGWWIVPYWIIPAAINVFGEKMGGDVKLVAGALSLLITIAILIELGYLRGTTGPNAYGGNPAAMPPPLPAAV
jgi:uncharacterized membrane protein YhaH (DUF805 family)